MLKHKIQSYKVPPAHASSAWIAHNAAMEHKRPLLGQGLRPVIGCMYRPRIVPMAAVERSYVPPKSTFWRRAELFACVGAVFSLMVLLGHMGG